ncbi:hypothetical protein AB4Z09_28815 [Rhodococcus sp. TAF43]|uniref:hypothetical protein n=1 Tax=Rhodococcus sp. TAF43 TaxID=3237483 RepID=UPI003F95D227
MTRVEQVFVHPSEPAAERGSHYVEGAVRAYLMRDLADTDKWVLDPSSFGDGLFSDYDEHGPVSAECQCEKPEECAAVVGRLSRG